MNKVCFLLLWGVILPCLGQTPTDEIPPGNPTQFPTGDAAWQVDLTYDGLKAGAAGTRAQKINIIQVGNVRCNVITYSDGSTAENWHFNSKHYMAVEDPKTKSVVIVWDTLNLATVLTVGFDNSSFIWIGPSFFKDTISYQEKDCYHYKGTVTFVQPGGHGQKSSTVQEAWIDKKTLLPVGLDNGSCVALFSFLPTPTEPLTPPQNIARAVSQWDASLTPVGPSKIYRAPQ